MPKYHPNGYLGEYDPATDPFGGSAHCEWMSNRLAEIFGPDASVTYRPSPDGQIVSFSICADAGEAVVHVENSGHSWSIL